MSKNKPVIICDRYVLQEARQTGGMTTVYQARDLQTDMLVAIIVLRKSNVTERYPNGAGSLDARMRDRSLS